MKEIINKKNLIAGLQACPECEEDIIYLYTRADTIRTMIHGCEAPEWMRTSAKVYQYVHEAQLDKKFTAIACQVLGVLAKCQRNTGYKILNRYLKTDEDKDAMLRELCSIFDEVTSDKDEYKKYSGLYAVNM